MSPRTSCRLQFLLALLISSSIAGALEPRVENTSLNVPENPPVLDIGTEPAFEGISFTQPVAIVTPPGETNRLFIVEKGGTIRVIPDLTNPVPETFLSIPVNSDSEGGLLGLAFHPGYQTNRQFFVFYTRTISTSQGSGLHDRISRFEIDPSNTNRVLEGSEQALISQFDQAGNHNAGDVHFGPDGYLYVSTGDEGGGGDTYNNSGTITKDFFSAILRIDMDRRAENLEPNDHPAIHRDSGEQAFYKVPADNPFIGATSFRGNAINDPSQIRTEFWAVGLRNPWRFSFDPLTGNLLAGDVGQGSWEEVNHIEGGKDYGWNLREGAHTYSGTVPPGVELTDPIHEYGRSLGYSITGGVVYRGNRIPELDGHYVFGDYGSGRVWAFTYNGSQVSNHRQITTASQPVGFGYDPSNGDILIARYNGALTRLVLKTVANEIPPTLSDTGAFSDLASLTPEPGIVPYDINVPFWSDHAAKTRWFSIPAVEDTMGFQKTGNWSFPSGTVWIKHFDLQITNGAPDSLRRLETRFLIRNNSGVHGFTYRWNEDQNEAFLVGAEGMDEPIEIYESNGDLLRNQTWHYPARSECLQCHTETAGLALGFNTVQLNREFDFGSGSENIIQALEDAGYLSEPVENIHILPALASTDNDGVSLEYRVRSYLQANCVQCHQPGAAGLGNWDARISVTTEEAALINGELFNPEGDAENRVVVPGDSEHSMLLQRILRTDSTRMPPLASSEMDTNSVALLTEWIETDLANNYQTFAQWQDAHFPSPDDPNAVPGEDPDEDGADNYTEWLTGTDAWNENDFWKIDLEQQEGMNLIQFDQIANLGFEVQFKNSLLPEAPWMILNVPSNRPEYPAATQGKVVEDPDTGAAEKFYRVRIIQP